MSHFYRSLRRNVAHITCRPIQSCRPWRRANAYHIPSVSSIPLSRNGMSMLPDMSRIISKKLRRVRHPNIAPWNCRTSQGATRQLRTLRLSHVAPCNITLSHLATFACRTLRLKKPAFAPKNSRFAGWSNQFHQKEFNSALYGVPDGSNSLSKSWRTERYNGISAE